MGVAHIVCIVDKKIEMHLKHGAKSLTYSQSENGPVSTTTTKQTENFHFFLECSTQARRGGPIKQCSAAPQ